ncbi:hypothetical protein ACQKIY_25625 [Bacillus mycoides]|uniref:hypothetical protein n=1 Tax=Bacillus mycoides TaxID=1405 RepID=UPI003CFF4440
MKYYGDCDSAEIIKNRTICVKEGNRIRNIRDESDLHKELLVFVNNIVQHGEYVIFDIPRFTPLRYTIINHTLR